MYICIYIYAPAAVYKHTQYNDQQQQARYWLIRTSGWGLLKSPGSYLIPNNSAYDFIFIHSPWFEQATPSNEQELIIR